MARLTKEQKLYCWDCLLFSAKHWSCAYNGFSDLWKLSKSAHHHQNASSHLKATIRLKSFEGTRIEFLAPLDPQLFWHYSVHFPNVAFVSLMGNYGAYFNQPRLYTELSVLNSMSDFAGESSKQSSDSPHKKNWKKACHKCTLSHASSWQSLWPLTLWRGHSPHINTFKPTMHHLHGRWCMVTKLHL